MTQLTKPNIWVKKKKIIWSCLCCNWAFGRERQPVQRAHVLFAGHELGCQCAPTRFKANALSYSLDQCVYWKSQCVYWKRL